MEDQIGELKKERRTLAVVMAVAGAMFWFFIDSKNPIIRDLLKGLGIFIFIYGLVFINRQKQKWSELSFEKKLIKIVSLVILILLVLLTFLANLV